MSFLYILECMFLLVISTGSGNVAGTTMITTGEKPTNKELIVAVLGWLAVYLIITFIILTVRIIRKRIRRKRGIPEKKPKTTNSEAVEKQLYETFYNNKFSKWYFYVCECATLSFLYNHNDKKLYSTGKKATKKEYLNFVWFWLSIAVVITFVVLLCVFFK